MKEKFGQGMDFAVPCRMVEVHQSTMQVCHLLILYVSVVALVDSWGLCGQPKDFVDSEESEDCCIYRKDPAVHFRLVEVE